MVAQDFKNYVLEDSTSEFGGVSYVGETLDEFMEELGLPMDTPMIKVNEILEECGIKPINIL